MRKVSATRENVMAARVTNLTNDQRQMVATALYQLADAYENESEITSEGDETRQFMRLASEARELAAMIEQFKHVTGIS
jgi:hypothetical protein